MGERVGQIAKVPEVKQSDSNSRVRRTERLQSMDTSVNRILYLQRTAGNQVVSRLMKSGALQAKLRIGQPGDVYELEADRVADAVMRMPEPGVQRQVEPEEEEEELQAKATSGHLSEVTPNLEFNILSLKGGGQPLSESERTYFEPRFGRDFSQVRVHTDERAAESAQAVNARAFTKGQDIYFSNNQHQPSTNQGQRLLAHELTHTIQQGERQPFNRLQLFKTPERGEEEEILIPTFDIGGKSSCYQLVKQEPLLSGGSGEKGAQARVRSQGVGGTGPFAELIRIAMALIPIKNFSSLLSVWPLLPLAKRVSVITHAMSLLSGVGGTIFRLWPQAKRTSVITHTMSLLSGVGGTIFKVWPLLPIAKRGSVITHAVSLLSGVGGSSLKLWQRLPLTIRASVITRAIKLAISGVAFIPKVGFGLIGNWFRAGLIGFLRRIQRLGDKAKVFLFEKYLSIAFGQNIAYLRGYIKGLFEGFFVDGLVGIIQMVIDIICLIGKIPQLVTSLLRFFGAFPEHMQKLALAIQGLGDAMDTAAANAVSEVKAMFRNPIKIIGLLTTFGAAKEAVGRRMGEMIADGLILFIGQPAERIGKTVGRLSGMALFEVVLAVITSGGGLAVTAGKFFVRAAIKLMAIIGRRLLAIGRLIMSTIRLIMPFVRQAGRHLTRFFRAVAEKLHKALRAVVDFFAEILRRCRPSGSWRCRIPRRRQPGKRKPWKKVIKDKAGEALRIAKLPKGAVTKKMVKDAIKDGIKKYGIKPYGQRVKQKVGGITLDNHHLLDERIVRRHPAFKWINPDEIPSVVVHPRFHVGYLNEPTITTRLFKVLPHKDIAKLKPEEIFRRLRKFYKEAGVPEAFDFVEDFIRKHHKDLAKHL